MSRVLLSLSVIAFVLSMGATPGDCRESGLDLKVGLGMSELKGDDSKDLDGRSRVVVGLEGYISLSSILGLQPGLFYVAKGAQRELSPFETEEDVWYHEAEETWKLDYLEIPLLLRLSLKRGEGTRPYLLIGPAVSYNINAEIHTRATAAETAADRPQDINSSTSFDVEKSIDYGVMAGVGFEALHGSKNLSVEIRYLHGLETNVHEKQLRDPSGEPYVERREWTIGTLMVLFGLDF